MTDYTSVLTQIAEAANAIAGTPNYWWTAPIAVLISAMVAYWASQRTIAMQDRRQRAVDDHKRALVFHLLRDEITLRWKGEIYPYLQKLIKDVPIDGLIKFADMELRREDLFTFRTVSESFPEYFFLGDHRLVSEIVHGYLLHR